MISHGLTKEGAVPARDIGLAVSRKTKFEHEPGRRTYKECIYGQETDNQCRGDSSPQVREG